MEFLSYIMPRIVVWVLVLVRVTGIFVSAPVFASQQIPAQVRVVVAVALSVALAPLATPQTAPMPTDVFLFASAVVREALLGVALGFIPALVFLALQYAAELVDLQVGMGLGGWVDPTFRTQVSALGNFQYLLATVVFLSLDGHHLLLGALAGSFRLIPLGAAVFSAAMAQGVSHLFATMGLFGVQVAAPILAVLLITDLGMGILGRAAPQLNLLIMSPSMKAVLALGALGVALPLLALLMAHLFSGLRTELFSLVRFALPGGVNGR